MELHVCVDNLITIKIWKCIRRFHLTKWSQIWDKMKKESKKDMITVNVTALLQDDDDGDDEDVPRQVRTIFKKVMNFKEKES